MTLPERLRKEARMAPDLIAVMMDQAATELEKLAAWLSIEDAAKHMRVSRGTMKGILRSGELPYSRIGRLIRIRLSDVEALFDAKIVVNKDVQVGSTVVSPFERFVEKTKDSHR